MVRHLIDIVSKPAPLRENILVLLERRDYEEMLVPVEKIFDSIRAHNPSHPMLAQYYGLIATIKNYAKATGRKDRAVYYTRFCRWELVSALVFSDMLKGHADEQVLIKMSEKYQAEYLRTINHGESDLNAPLSFLMTKNVINNYGHKFEHSFSLPIPAIQNYVLTNQSMAEVVAFLNEAEKVWKETRRQSLAMQNGDKIVIQFPDGFAWVKLSRGHCEAEANAMGHCGNAGARRDESILSLRRPVEVDGETLWRPSLTFILGGNGKLGEMKGRGNEKPAAKYHPYIMKLLEAPFVTGIKGGGYLPENNFALSDLSEQQQVEIAKTKPAMATFALRLKMHGDTDDLRHDLADVFREDFDADIDWNYPRRQNNWIVAKFSTVDELISQLGSDNLRHYFDGAYHDDFEIDRALMEQCYDELSDEVHQKLIAKARSYISADQLEDFEDELDNDEAQTVIQTLDENNDDNFGALATGARWAVEAGAQASIAKKVRDALETWQPDFVHVEYSRLDGQIVYDDPVYFTIPLETACGWADCQDDDDFDGVPMDIRHGYSNAIRVYCGDEKQIQLDDDYDNFFDGWDAQAAIEGFDSNSDL